MIKINGKATLNEQTVLWACKTIFFKINVRSVNAQITIIIIITKMY